MSLFIIGGQLIRTHGKKTCRWFVELYRWILANPERKRAFRLGAISGGIAGTIVAVVMKVL